MTGRSTIRGATAGRGTGPMARGWRLLTPVVVVVLIGWGAVVACRGPAGSADVAPSAWTGQSCLPATGATATPLPGGTARSPGATATPLPGGTARSPGGTAPAPPSATTAGALLPDLVLSCFDGGRTRLSQLSAPVIVNLWASWCAPCRTELPAFQDFHSRVAGAVTVVGVATQERGRQGAESLIEDLGLEFPMLWDPEGALLRGLGRTALPVTLYIAPGGRIAHLYSGAPLDSAGVEALAATHLGGRGDS